MVIQFSLRLSLVRPSSSPSPSRLEISFPSALNSRKCFKQDNSVLHVILCDLEGIASNMRNLRCKESIWLLLISRLSKFRRWLNDVIAVSLV